jgi:osmotically-inducible protein OsmY
MPKMSKLTTFAAGAGIGAAAAFFLDNQSGNRRRKLAADKAARFTREGAGTVQGAAQSAGAQAKGAAAKAQHKATGGDSAPGDDNTLKNKVQSEIFRDADAPKGSVDVSVVDGIVELRGQVDEPAQAEALALKARMVSGVRDVRNLLHLPGETPPNIVGTPGVSSS